MYHRRMEEGLPARYRLVARLGEGGAGAVFLVDDLELGGQVALKILKGELDDREIAGRWKREVRAFQRLEHPNIVEIHDHGLLPDGRMYLTMEAVSGEALDRLLHRRGPLSIAATLGILADAADALHHAHERDVIHRDIKPGNLVLAPCSNGSILKILDFGLAKILASDLDESVKLSRTGMAFGTPKYMSPEQCRGTPLDGRTDLYSLGCVGYELLIGEPPFPGMLAELFAAHLKRPPPVPSQADPTAGIPPELDTIVMRCLAKDPLERFQTGGALSTALRSVPGYRPLRRDP